MDWIACSAWAASSTHPARSSCVTVACSPPLVPAYRVLFTATSPLHCHTAIHVASCIWVLHVFVPVAALNSRRRSLFGHPLSQRPRHVLTVPCPPLLNTFTDRSNLLQVLPHCALFLQASPVPSRALHHRSPAVAAPDPAARLSPLAACRFRPRERQGPGAQASSRCETKGVYAP